MPYITRLANLPTEYPAIAAVLAAENPGWAATAAELTTYNRLAERLQEQGLAVKTYTELVADPDRPAKLHELDWAIWQSIPYGQAVTKRTLAQFAAQEIDHPKFIANACFIAVKAGEFFGYSNLVESDAGFSTEMTGVLPAWHHRGIATTLKLAGIHYAQAHNAKRLDTQNDATNHAMIALNQKLGFTEEGATLRFVKKMT